MKKISNLTSTIKGNIFPLVVHGREELQNHDPCKKESNSKTSISKLHIKTLQNALKDVDKLERLYLKVNERQSRSMQIEERQTKVVTKRLKCSGLCCI